MKRNNSLSLQARLVFFVLFVSLIPLIVITTRDILQTQQALTNGAEISLRSSAAQTANSLDNFIQKTLDSVGTEAQFTDLIDYLTISPVERADPVVRERTLGLLKNLSKKDSINIISYGLVDSSGNVLLDSATDREHNESAEPYFLPVQFSDKPVVSYVTYEDDKTTSIIFASAIRNTNGAYIGVLRIKYKSAILQDVILKSVGPSTDTSVQLLDQYSIRLADSQNPELILKSVTPLKPVDYSIAVKNHRLLNTSAEEQATNYPDFEAALDNAVNEPFFRIDITPNTAGDDTVAVANLQTQSWVVAYSRPTSIFLADVQKQIRTNIILVLSALIIILMVTLLIARSLTNPLAALAKVANTISQGDLSARAQVNSTDEIGMLASAFNRMTDELNQTFNSLEVRVAERTTDLEIARQLSEKRAGELQSIGEISKVITGEQKLENLLPLISHLVSERFGFYHIGIFLIDETNQFAVLQAANSEGGKNMLARGHRLEVGGSGIVGYVSKFGAPRIALDVGLDAVFFNNPDLPNTRSELALPLKVRDQTIGVLDVQSDKPGAFIENDTNTLSILADQIAIALENARLFTQTQQALSEAQALYRQNSQGGWLTFSREEASVGYQQSLQGGRKLTAPVETAEIRQAMNRGSVLVFNTDEAAKESSIVVPIKLRGQVIGALNIKAPSKDRRWSNDEVNLAEAISERLSLALENARLIQESQRQVIKEQTISEVTGKIGASINLKNVLQTAVEELGRALPGSEVVLQLQNENKDGNKK
jgi:GAF domain-containing protein/HAMP domain-containing protein